jgi:hypothetical protein
LLGCLAGRKVIGCLTELIINSVTTDSSAALVIWDFKQRKQKKSKLKYRNVGFTVLTDQEGP